MPVSETWKKLEELIHRNEDITESSIKTIMNETELIIISLEEMIELNGSTNKYYTLNGQK